MDITHTDIIIPIAIPTTDHIGIMATIGRTIGTAGTAITAIIDTITIIAGNYLLAK